MSLCCECCALSGRGLCDELITRPEESYRLWCAVVCALEKQTSLMRRPRPTRGLWRQERERKNRHIEHSSPLAAVSTAHERSNYGECNILIKTRIFFSRATEMR